MDYRMNSSAKRQSWNRRCLKMADVWMTVALIAAVVPAIKAASLWPQTDCCSYDVIFYVDILDMTEFEFFEMSGTIRLISESIEMDSSRGNRLGLVLVPGAVGEIPLTSSRTDFQNGLDNIFYIPRSPRNVASAITRVQQMFEAAPWRPRIRKVAIGLLNGLSIDPNATAYAAHTARIDYVYMGVIGVMAQPVDATFRTELEDMGSVPESKYVHIAESYTSLRTGNIEQFFSEIVIQSGICCDCQWRNYLHFYADPADPNAYFQCVRRQGFVRRFCAADLFWDQTKSSCRPAVRLDVKDDPCKWYDWEVYAVKSNRHCRSYWVCSPGIKTVYTECCPEGARFNILSHVFDCVRDDTCSQGCKPISADEHSLPTLIPSIQTPPLPTIDRVQDQCTPELLIDFTDSYKDLRGTYVENHGVRVLTGTDVPEGTNSRNGIRGVGYFNGNAYLVVPRFAFAWYGRSIEYRFRYRPILPSFGGEFNIDRQDILLTNGDCGVDDSIRATYLPNQHLVSTTERGRVTPLQSLSVPADYRGESGEWLTVTVKLQNDDLSIESEESNPPKRHSDSTPFFRDLEQTKPALHIGGYTDSTLNQFVSFHGYIDEFWLYLCDQ